MGDDVTGTSRIAARDMPDFERVLNTALNTTQIHEALQRVPEAPGIAGLRTRARDAADTVIVPAGTAYDAYLAAREAAPAPRRPRPKSGGRLLPALGVLVPAVSATAAVALLLLGPGLGLTGAQPELADSLTSMGWACAGLAALSAAVGLTAVVVTALRNRAAPPGRPPGPRDPAVRRARDTWMTSLLDDGMLPFLHGVIREAAMAPDDPDEDRSAQPGYTGPDFASPDYAGPELGGHTSESAERDG